MFKGIKDDTLTYEDYGYFNFEAIPINEIEKILDVNKKINQKIEENRDLLFKIIKYHEKIELIINLAESLLFFSKEDREAEGKFKNDLINLIRSSSKMKKPYRPEEKVPLVVAEVNSKLINEIL